MTGRIENHTVSAGGPVETLDRRNRDRGSATAEFAQLRLSATAFAVMGIPLDLLSEDAFVAHIRRCVAEQRHCLISTPNLSFVMSARSDPAFRDTVMKSELNTADGMPVVLAARMLGAGAASERVAGSSIFDRLRRQHTEPAIKVYLFGGLDGVAERAAAQLNGENGGFICVGFHNPGFGSVEEMSTPEIIDAVNASGADFILVALNARKGQLWLARNHELLVAPVRMQLGATINFVAGGVRRAPRWVQRIGAEWLWRIVEEPVLWRRYLGDGGKLIAMLLGEILPLGLRSGSRVTVKCSPKVDVVRADGLATVHISGAWAGADQASLRATLERVSTLAEPLAVDLSGLETVDGRFVAAIMRFEWYRRSTGPGVDFGTVPKRVVQAFTLYGGQFLFAAGSR